MASSMRQLRNSAPWIDLARGMPALAVVLVFLLGCGANRDRVPVEGTVVRAGKPLGNILVEFVPDIDAGGQGEKTSGVTDAAGRFHMRAAHDREGIASGAYRVTLEDLDVYRAKRTEDGTLVRPVPTRVPPAYRDPISTPLRTIVFRGMESPRFDVGLGH